MTIDTDSLTDVAARIGVNPEDVQPYAGPAPAVRRPARVVIGDAFIEIAADHTTAELAEAFERAERVGYVPISSEECEPTTLDDGHIQIPLVLDIYEDEPGETAVRLADDQLDRLIEALTS